MPFQGDWHQYVSTTSVCTWDYRSGAPFVAIPHGSKAMYFEGDTATLTGIALMRRETSQCTGDGGNYLEDGILRSFVHLDILCGNGAAFQLSQRRLFVDPVTPTYDSDEGYGLRLTKQGGVGVDSYRLDVYEFTGGVASILATPVNPLTYGANEWIHIGFEVVTSGANDLITVKTDPTLTYDLAWASWANVYGPYTSTAHKSPGMVGIGIGFGPAANQWCGVDAIKYDYLP